MRTSARPRWSPIRAAPSGRLSTRRAALPPRFTFVGGHPLGGAAKGGLEHARPDLFTNRPWLLTPTGDGTGDAVDRLSTFVRALGADPRILSVAAHDRLLGYLSHLPQLTASALMQVIGDAVGGDGLAFAGRGLLDTTRLASSPADIWKDIAATNADEIRAALDALDRGAPGSASRRGRRAIAWSRSSRPPTAGGRR